MALPTHETIRDRLAQTLLENDCLAPESSADAVLEKLSVEDHLILLEEMLAKTGLDGTSRAVLLRSAHANVSNALDLVLRWTAGAL